PEVRIRDHQQRLLAERVVGVALENEIQIFPRLVGLLLGEERLALFEQRLFRKGKQVAGHLVGLLVRRAGAENSRDRDQDDGRSEIADRASAPHALTVPARRRRARIASAGSACPYTEVPATRIDAPDARHRATFSSVTPPSI